MEPKALLKTALPLAVLLGTAAGVWAMMATAPRPESAALDESAPVVGVVRVEPRTLRLDVASQGVVAPRLEIDLVPEVAGKITYLHPGLAAGGRFALGEVLLRIAAEDYKLAIAEAEAGVAAARRQLAQELEQAEQARSEWQTLGEGQASPLYLRQPQIAEARAKLKAAETALAQAKRQRGRCEWRAPFAGRVRDKQVGLGQYVQAGDKLAGLYADDRFEVRLPIAPEQLALLDLPWRGQSDPGPKVVFSASLAGKTRRWEGRVVRMESAVDPDSGQWRAVAEVVDAPTANAPPLAPGLFVQASIEGRPLDGVFALPLAAVKATGEAVLVDADNRLRPTRLDILRMETDRWLIGGGLRGGDRVVVSGLELPVAGARVETQEWSAAP